MILLHTNFHILPLQSIISSTHFYKDWNVNYSTQNTQTAFQTQPTETVWVCLLHVHSFTGTIWKYLNLWIKETIHLFSWSNCSLFRQPRKSTKVLFYVILPSWLSSCLSLLLLFTPDWTPSGCVWGWCLWRPQRRSGCFLCLWRR